MALEVAVCLPLLALLIPGLVTGSVFWGLGLLVVGPAYGFGLGDLVRRAAARRWVARAPEVLQVLSSAHT